MRVYHPAIGILLFFLLSVFTSLTSADATHASNVSHEAIEQYKLGIRAFQTREYQNALTHFLRARELGLEIPRLYFNLGSTLFRLNDPQAAYDAFSKAVNDPKLTVLSHINLALCALQLENRNLAQTHLATALSLSRSEKYRRQILGLVEKHQLVITPQRRASIWQGSLGLSIGYNDNVELIEETQQATESKDNDNFLYSALDLSLTAHPNFVLQGALRILEYEHIESHDYDTAEIQSGFRFKGDRWHYELLAKYKYSQLDDQAFLVSPSLYTQLGRNLGTLWFLSASLQKTQHANQTDEYEHLRGEQLESGLALQYKTASGGMGLNYHVEKNDRLDLTDQQNRLLSSYSPRRWSTGIHVWVNTRKQSQIALSTYYRKSQYPAGGRTDYRLWGSLSFSTKVTDHSRWSLNVSAIDNQAQGNMAEEVDYSYQTWSVTTGLTWHF